MTEGVLIETLVRIGDGSVEADFLGSEDCCANWASVKVGDFAGPAEGGPSSVRDGLTLAA
ncbi:hypothetical protein [Streptomyces sp. NPDC101181]|uniref:hypothetical protein n=1 Tax=Streptomyces sp. NPDC101181 TaxID=3366125 RepID=UPI003829DE2E